MRYGKWLKVFCQICGEHIADTTLELLKYPLAGYMFKSPDAAHGVPDPFDARLDWEFMRCPFGRTHRPMAVPDLILTDQGMVRLPKDGGPAFLDPTAKVEVDRDSIGDRVLSVSDEEAERQAREILQGGPKVVVSDKVPVGTVLAMDKGNILVIEDPNIPQGGPVFLLNSEEKIHPVEVGVEAAIQDGKIVSSHTYRTDGTEQTTQGPEVKMPIGFPCPVCGKSFSDERKMKGHIGGAHRRGKK